MNHAGQRFRRRISGKVLSAAGKTIADCHVDVVPISGGVQEIAIFTDNEGRWSLQVQDDAAYELRASLTPGSNDGSILITAGYGTLSDVSIFIGSFVD